MSEAIPFHLAFPVRDIEQTRRFYTERLGAKVGRSAERWIDFDFFGHQISAHLVDEPEPEAATNPVDGKSIPVRHFGLVLPWARWHQMAESLKAAGQDFLVEPHIRWPGQIGEQATMFFLDPSGNAIELKSFKDPSQLFAT